VSKGGGSHASLDEEACNVAEVLASVPDDVLIVSHLDADGLSSGGIMMQALLRAGLSPMIRIVKQLDEGVVTEISSHPFRSVVFTDLGSGQKPLLQNLKEKRVVVVDHHQPAVSESATATRAEIFEFNPHLYGFDGASEISASGTAYLLAVKMDEANKDLADLAIVGALGDLQDKGAQSTLTGLNAKIVAEAEKAGLLKVKKGLKLYGFESRPLIQCMSYSFDPYLPGLTGDEGACLKFLKGLGVEPRKGDGSWRSIADLPMDELKLVINGLIKYLISQGLPSNEAEKIVGAIYIFACEAADGPLRDAREFASSINACGRLGRYGLGVSIAMGDRETAYEELKGIMQEYRKTISGYLNWVEKNKGSAIKILPHIQALFGGKCIDDKMIGTVISIALSTKPFLMDRPIVGFANSSGVVKVSARGTAELVKKGLNLGNIMKEAAEVVGGAGGGHNIAAGAQIPEGEEEVFLKIADELVLESVVGASE